MTPDQILRHAARILQAEPYLAPAFLELLGVTPTLTVYYESGETQEWAGPPEDWPEHVEEYEITADSVERVNVSLERHLYGDWNPFPLGQGDARSLADLAIKVLRDEGLYTEGGL